MKNSIYFSSEVLLDFGMDSGMVLGGFWEENVIKNVNQTNNCNKGSDQRAAFIQFLKSCSSDGARQSGIQGFIQRYNIDPNQL